MNLVNASSGATTDATGILALAVFSTVYGEQQHARGVNALYILEPEHVADTRTLRSAAHHELHISTARAKEILGWEPAVPLREGIARLRRWLDEPDRNTHVVTVGLLDAAFVTRTRAATPPASCDACGYL